MAKWYVLDTSVLLGGHEPPPDGRWATSPEAESEISPGGKDARRFDGWKDRGLVIRAATPESEDRVDEVAMAAGSLGRLSVADRSVLALAMDMEAVLVTDDHTLLDVARRMEVPTLTQSSKGIEGTKDWRPRCLGCGRWFEAPQKKDECPVCGSAVAPKPCDAGARARH